MGQHVPEDNLFAKSLEKEGQDRIPSGRGRIVDVHLFYPQQVVLLRNPQRLHSDEVSHVRSGSGISNSTEGECLARNLNISCDHHGVWQSPMGFSKPP